MVYNITEKNKMRGQWEIMWNVFRKKQLYYLIENANWSIRWDGEYLCNSLNKQNLINAEVKSSIPHCRNRIIHFGSINLFLDSNGNTLMADKLNNRNQIVVTWFHVVPDSVRNEKIGLLAKQVDILHTSSVITRDKLVKLGFPAEKIVVIPLGIDLAHFRRFAEDERRGFRIKLGIPRDKIVIGSFQKDGNGWGSGDEPKMIKGPDVFCDAVEHLATEFPIHVLLTGPARGYVKKRLEKAGISYTHEYLKNYLDIVKYYNCLDLYLVTSRAEGGPKAILESLATGVPLVTTDVGMASTVIRNNENGFVVGINEVEELVRCAEVIVREKNLKNEFIKNGLERARDYNWDAVARQYFDKIYKNLLSEL